MREVCYLYEETRTKPDARLIRLSGLRQDKEEANESQSTQSKRLLVFETTGELDASQIAELIAQIQKITGDASLTIKKIEQG